MQKLIKEYAMLSSELIGKHLQLEDIHSDIAKCAICGLETDRNILLNKALSEKFNDFQYIRYNSDRICVYCKACLSSDSWDGKAIRNFSFIATESELIAIKRKDLPKYTFSTHAVPFVFCVTFTGKKHTFFNALVNESRERYIIATEKGSVEIIPEKHFSIYEACQSLYDQGLSKNEILTGNYKKWSKIGDIPDFWQLEERIMPYRNTFLLKFLTFIMTKETENDQT